MIILCYKITAEASSRLESSAKRNFVGIQQLLLYLPLALGVLAVKQRLAVGEGCLYRNPHSFTPSWKGSARTASDFSFLGFHRLS